MFRMRRCELRCDILDVLHHVFGDEDVPVGDILPEPSGMI
jgi:hypothetical protein